MKNMFRRRKPKYNSFHKIWLKLYLVTLISVLLPTVILGGWFSFTWREQQLNSHIAESNAYMQNISRTIHQNFLNIENDIQFEKTDSTFYDYKKMSKPGEYVTELQSVSKRLVSLYQKYSFITSTYFYDPYYNIIASNVYGTYDMQDFSDNEWIAACAADTYQIQRLDARMNANKEILNDEVQLRLLQYRPEPVLTIVGSGTRSIKIAVNVSLSGLIDYLDDIYRLENGDFYIMRASKEVLAANTHSMDTADFAFELAEHAGGYIMQDTGGYFIQKISETDLYCVLYQPLDAVQQSYQYFQRYIWTICLIIIAVTAGTAVVLSKQVYSPVEDMVKNIHGLARAGKRADEVKDEIAYIKEIYDDLENSHETMRKTLNSYEHIVSAYNFKAFLNEMIPYEQVAEMVEAIRGRAEEERPFQVALLRIAKSAEIPSSSRLNGLDIIDTYINSAAKGAFLDMDNRTYLAFLSGSAECLKDLIQIISRIIEEIFETEVFVGVSKVCEDNTQILHSFQQAKQTMEHAHFFGIHEICSPEGQPEKTTLDVSLLADCEAGIVKAILSRDMERVSACFRTLETLRGHMYVSSVRASYHRLLTTIMKEFKLTSISQENYIEEFRQLETLSEMQDFLMSLAEKTIQHLKTGKDASSKYCTKAKHYIEENYMKNLSVSDISDAIGISYTHLSKLFKDCEKVGLLDYLNIVRIEKSKKYLLQTDDTIAKISEQVGYNNAQSYQRFFKKMVGLTPGEYRRSIDRGE